MNIRLLTRLAPNPGRSISSSSARFPTVRSCPPATCPCAPTPSFPDTHPIDRTSPLNGVVASYALQMVVCTGRQDWPSRIEDEDSGQNPAATLKGLYGPRGAMFDFSQNISVLNSSFPPTPPSRSLRDPGPSVYLFPSMSYIAHFPLPPTHKPPILPPAAVSPPSSSSSSSSPSSSSSSFSPVLQVRDVVVLICGHGARDERCGVMGPLLKAEFEEKLALAGVDVRRGCVDGDEGQQQQQWEPKRVSARVGLVSHVGGHKFAGNVIIYFPPNHKIKAKSKEVEEEVHPLAGLGIWYGRVGPQNVEGIVAETILGGNVVEDMFRGGIGSDGKMLRL